MNIHWTDNFGNKQTNQKEEKFLFQGYETNPNTKNK